MTTKTDGQTGCGANCGVYPVDLAVVGLGFAGAAVALEGLKQGWSVRVFQKETEDYPKASQVASGLINPLVLKRRRMVGGALQAWPIARDFYLRLEAETAVGFFSQVPVREHLATVKDANDWTVLADRPGFENLLDAQSVPNPFGGLDLHRLGAVRASGRLVPSKYFQAVQARLRGGVNNQTVIDLERSGEAWTLVGAGGETLAQAKRVVLCEGPVAPLAEKFWGDLEFALVRGEGLDIVVPELGLDGPLHGRFFLLPYGSEEPDRYKVGATYAWDGLEAPRPTPEGRAELEQWLQSWLKLPYTVVDHWCGVRPARKSREILCSWHPNVTGLGILNGLGSRGALMAPWKARQLLDEVLSGAADDSR